MPAAFQDRLQHALDADYLIERELGGGGMSRVFLAIERALQRRVVIKVLPPELAAGVNVDRFRREIQLAAQLQHPHIVPLLSAGDEDGVLWFSMPFIDGESLRGALTRQKKIPARDVVRIMHDVVDALAYAHARGVVHRDIKPDNILTSGMHALVTDFGVAKALSAAIPMAGGTVTGMVVGTPAYMAPEQLAADPSADHRVDIYAAGLLAYELVTGRAPFSGPSPQATMAAQLTQMPDPPQKFADLPEGLSAVIMHCLAKDAAKRPASAQALLAALDALPPMSADGNAHSAPASRRRWPFIAAGVGIAAVAFVLAQRFRQSPAAITADTLTARDVGPGGRRPPTIEIAKLASDPALRAKPETIVVYRNGTDSTQGITVPVVISRAESLAIAEAVRQRIVAIDAGKKTTEHAPDARIFISADGKSVTLDKAQLLQEVGKIFADSVARVFGRIDSTFGRGGPSARTTRFEMTRPTGLVTPRLAPPSDGRARIVVSNFNNTTGKRDLNPVGREVARFLRSALPTDRYTVVDSETTDHAARDLRDPISLGWGLRADYIVSGMVMQRADSVVLLTMFTDLRDGRFTRAQESMAPAADPRMAFDAALLHVNAWLDTATVLRARRAANPQQRGPGGIERRN